MRRSVLWLLGALTLFSADLSAQAEQISPGTRVRISTPAHTEAKLVGAVVSFDLDSLVLCRTTEEVVRIHSISLNTLEISRGRNKVLWGLGGAGVGLILGVAVGAASGFGSSEPETLTVGEFVSGDWLLGRMERAANRMVVGALVGGRIGAVTGIVVAPERWRRVTLRFR